MTPSVAVLDTLVEWLAEHHASGGDYSVEAVRAAGDAAVKAEVSGLSAEQCFEAGRSAYFAAMDRVSVGMSSTRTPHSLVAR